MDQQEFDNWKRFTESSKHDWTVDPCHDKKEDFLAFIGGSDGYYAMICGSELILGEYKGAIPHIGEALFREVWSQKFNNSDEAHLFLKKTAGIKFNRISQKS